MLALGGSEIAYLVEDVVSGEQHFGLNKIHPAIAQQGGGVHHGLTRLRVGGSDQAADDGDALGFGGDLFDGFPIARNK